MEQLILHLAGDYVTQSDWMAQNKTKAHWPAFCHALVYSLPFLWLGSAAAMLVILATHFTIDRWRLARFVVYAKNVVLGHWLKWVIWCGRQGRMTSEQVVAKGFGEFANDSRTWEWKNCRDTGYPSTTPSWLAVWLLIAADNTLHLAINYAALRWL